MCLLSSIPLAGETKETTIVTIGDKGRAQLARGENKMFQLAFQDTYKMRVSFSQVRGAYISLLVA